MSPRSDLPYLPDLHNLRDLGGLGTVTEGKVREGVLYRCATPAFVDEAQTLQLVNGLGIRTRIDLRTAAEVEAETSDALRAGERKVVQLEIKTASMVWSYAEAVRPEWVGAYYADYLRASSASIVALARLLLDVADLPALVHCTAGKDRTGTIVALLLDAVGVVTEDIVADYVRTNEHMPSLREQFDELPAYANRLEAVPVEAFAAHPEAIRSLLRFLQDEYGGGRAYLAMHRMTESELDALTAVLVES